MHRNALRAVASADIVVLVRDLTDSQPDPDLPRPPDLIVHTKSDLAQASPGIFAVSALTGANLDKLKEELDRLAFGESGGAGAFSLALNARHIRAISDARDALQRAVGHVRGDAAELVALELRESLDAIGSVVGMVTPDDLLGRIFSAFCIGK